MTILEALRATPLFSSLPETTLSEIVRDCVRVKRQEGEVLFHEGATGDSLYVLLRGGVAVERDFGGGSVLVNQLGPGECLGEMTLLDGGPRSATVVCQSDSEFLQLSRSAFQVCLRQRPEIALGTIELLCTRLRKATEVIAQTQALDLKERLSSFLLSQSFQDRSGAWIYRRTRDSDIARSIGAKRESVSRKLKEMHAEGWIERTTNTIVLKDREQLQQFASGMDILP